MLAYARARYLALVVYDSSFWDLHIAMHRLVYFLSHVQSRFCLELLVNMAAVRHLNFAQNYSIQHLRALNLTFSLLCQLTHTSLSLLSRMSVDTHFSFSPMSFDTHTRTHRLVYFLSCAQSRFCLEILTNIDQYGICMH